MLVDDEEDLRLVVGEALESMGYRVITAGNGEEALAIYGRRDQEIDLVVLDLGMPGMGGQRCLEEILARYPQAKVIIASGYAPGQQVKQALETGARGFVAKPYRLIELLGAIRKEMLVHPQK